MTLARGRFALNTLQWITVRLGDANVSPSDVGWEFDEPAFLAKQPRILDGVREAGFSKVMLEVLPTQTLQAYRRVVDASGLELSPGYIQVGLPEDYGEEFAAGSDASFRWFDGVRRRAEETLFMGLDRVFLAADMAPGRPRIDDAAAVGHDFDASRLDRVTDLIGRAADVLVAEGVMPGLHNHVGSWIETEEEFDHVLDAVPAGVLGIGPDLGHLAWAGVDIVDWTRRHGDRITDVHIKDLLLDKAAASRESPHPYFAVTGDRLFAEPGLGDLPLVEALAALPDSFAGDIIVEVDVPTMDPYESARVSGSWVAAHYAA